MQTMRIVLLILGLCTIDEYYIVVNICFKTLEPIIHYSVIHILTDPINIHNKHITNCHQKEIK